MKKLLFALVAAVALITTVCSTTNKASAAEEQGEVTPTASNVYSDNQFTSFCMNFFDSVKVENVFNDDNKYYSNLIHVEPGKEILLSLKIRPSKSNINKNKQIFITGLGITFDENFNRIGIINYDYNYGGQYGYIVGDSGEYFIYNYLLENISSEIKYISIGFDYIRYTDINGETAFSNKENIDGFYVGNVTADTINQEDMKNLEFDYTPYNSGMTWKYASNEVNNKYLQLDVSNEVIMNPVQLFSVTDKNGEKTTISCGMVDGYQIPTAGKNYNYILEAKDKDGNRDYLYVTLNCTDDEAPLISGPTEIKVNCMSLTDLSIVKNALKLKDNVDALEDIVLTVKYDYYSENYDKPGEYYICFTATDTSGNSSDFIVKMIVQDTNAPVFYDVTTGFELNKKLEVIKSLDSVFLLSDITSLLKAVDDVDGEVKIELAGDTYTGNGDKPGQYTITLKASDKADNISFTTVYISVIESMPKKTIVLNEDIIIVEQGIRLSEKDFHAILKVAGYYSPKKYGLNRDTTFYTNINLALYEPHYNEVGEYLVPLNITSPSGIDYDNTLIVKVVESRLCSSLIDTPEEPDGVIVSILKWIWNLLLSIYEWFIGLFK